MPNVLTVPNSGIISFDNRSYSNLSVPDLTSSARISYDSGGGINVASYATTITALDRFTVDGTQGRLFSVTDVLTGALFSVNNITGLPIVEVTDQNTVVAGQFNTNAVVVSGTRTGLGTRPIGSNRLSVSGDSTFVGSVSVSNIVTISSVQIRTKDTSNIFIGGSSTGRDATTGQHNFAFGLSAGNALTTGNHNNFLGRNAGYNNTTGSCNNFFGRCAGFSNSTGSSNTIIGTCANVQTNSLSGVVVIGTGAIATESHQIVLSTQNVVFRNFGNTFQIGAPELQDNLTVFGDLSSNTITLSTIQITGETKTSTTTVTATDVYVKVVVNNATKYLRLFDVA